MVAGGQYFFQVKAVSAYFSLFRHEVGWNILTPTLSPCFFIAFKLESALSGSFLSI
jgi:hypothetical protein